MKKFILHSVLGYQQEYTSKEEFVSAIETTCWGAAIKRTSIVDFDGTVHTYLYDYYTADRFILIDGGTISVPRESTAATEADAYVLNLPNFKKWSSI